MTIQEKVAECLVRAGSTFREDQKEAYRRAIADEQIESSCWVMKQILDNALVAEKNRGPLCDDTRCAPGIKTTPWSSYGY